MPNPDGTETKEETDAFRLSWIKDSYSRRTQVFDLMYIPNEKKFGEPGGKELYLSMVDFVARAGIEHRDNWIDYTYSRLPPALQAEIKPLIDQYKAEFRAYFLATFNKPQKEVRGGAAIFSVPDYDPNSPAELRKRKVSNRYEVPLSVSPIERITSWLRSLFNRS